MGNDPSFAFCMPICSQAKSLIERAMHLRVASVALGAYAVDEVFELAVVGVFDQSMNIGIKAWEFFVEWGDEIYEYRKKNRFMGMY